MANFYAQYPVVGGGSGTGNVTGPGSSVARTIPVFSDTTGKVLADTTAEIATNGDVTFAGNVTAVAGTVTVGILGVGNDEPVISNVPGTIVFKIQVFDSDGIALGYLPVYDTID